MGKGYVKLKSSNISEGVDSEGKLFLGFDDDDDDPNYCHLIACYLATVSIYIAKINASLIQIVNLIMLCGNFVSNQQNVMFLPF